MAESKYQRLIRLLKDMFQLGDAAELDFGIYRIMHARKAEIEAFLDQQLFQKHVKDALAGEAGGQRQKIEADLAKLEKTLKDAGVDPATAPKYQELVAKRDAEPDHAALENEVYAALLTFFGRYYSEGDFISQRRYGQDAYAIPYNGEEVKLHWANHDQYYIKSGEALKHYGFLVGPENARKRVRFKLVAATTERDNNKEQTGKERWHTFSKAEPITEEAGELVIPFEYRVVERDELVQRMAALKAAKSAKPDTGRLFKDESAEQATDELAESDKAVGKRPNMREELAALGAAEILAADSLPAVWRTHLSAAHTNSEGEVTGRTLLEHHVRRYMAKATFDYFIHKDLGGFLRRELDWYIKHELLHLQDILDDGNTLEQLGRRHFAKLRVLRTVAENLIDFLAQMENFQKKLWLKKKFVLETQYLIRVGIIPEEFYAEIAANDAQREEWVRLYAIDEVNAVQYSEPLTVEFLKAHPTLVVNTRNFERSLHYRLIAALRDLDEHCDAINLQGDNQHAMSLLGSRFRNQVKCIYIDPPYNTGNDGFLYRDSFKHSSWLTMLENRLYQCRELASQTGAIFVSIDDANSHLLKTTLASVFGSDQFLAQIVWKKRSTPPNDKVIGAQHEYIVGYAIDRAHVSLNYRPRSAERLAKYQNPDNHPKGPYVLGDLQANVKGGRYVESLAFPITNPTTGEKHYPRNRGNWRFSSTTIERLMANNEIAFGSDGTGWPKLKRFLCDVKEGITYTTLWDFLPMNSVGSSELSSMDAGPIAFENPKPIGLVGEICRLGTSADALVLEFFAGSGTTGCAVMSLNRADGGRRKCLLVEQGEYFDSVLLPRHMRMAFAPTWENGRPVRPATQEEADRSPRVTKVVRLESYEDACDNIHMQRTKKQQEAFAKLPEAEREKYRLHYMLDIESRGSASLLNLEKFARPFEYTLRVTRDDVTRDQTVDLVETFNWLLGLKVETIRLSKDKTFKADEHGIVEVTGEDSDGRRCLIVWRNTDEVDDDKLLKWFEANRHKVKDFEWDLIYVNGDNTLENLKRDDETWTVRLIEQEFHRLMFEGTE